MRAIDIPEINQLSTAEKILLLEDLWDSIALNESEILVPESHKAELDRRLEAEKETPGELLQFDQIKERIEKRK